MSAEELSVYTAAALAEALKSGQPKFEAPPRSKLTNGPSGTLVYFVQCRNFVKVGFSINPWIRAKEFSSWNPYQLNIIGVLDGGQKEEAKIHKALRPFAVHCEWFRMNDNIERIMCLHTFPYARSRRISHSLNPNTPRRNRINAFASKA